ncbi:MAG: heme ABC exporter ATP-binding protein CcmA, partial [Devosia sp.]
MTTAHAPAPPEFRAEDLALTRGEKRLFEALGFRLSAGSTLLVRGPNGAGKSSLLLSLAGIVRLDRGRVTYRDGGADLPIAENSHFLGHLSGVKPRLTLNENLAFWRVLLGRPARTNAEALERVGLAGLGGIEAGHLSAGQIRRLALARLLVAHRPLWLLD